MKKSLELNKVITHIRKRILYYIGTVFIYILPIFYIAPKINIVTSIKQEPHTSASITWCIVGVLYLIFLAKFVKTKINDMQPKPVKTFLQGITSLIPITILGAFINLVQVVINKIPKVDVAQYIWNTVLLIGLGLIFQIVDSIINKKYLYDLAIEKEAKRTLDVEKKKQELIKAREEMEG